MSYAHQVYTKSGAASPAIADSDLSPVAKAFAEWSQAINEFNSLPFESPETQQAFDAIWLPALLTMAKAPCRSLSDLRLKLYAFEYEDDTHDDRGLLASVVAEVERLAGPDAACEALLSAAPCYTPPQRFRMTKKRKALLRAVRDGSKARGVAWCRENIFAVYGMTSCHDCTTDQLAEIAAKLKS